MPRNKTEGGGIFPKQLLPRDCLSIDLLVVNYYFCMTCFFFLVIFFLSAIEPSLSQPTRGFSHAFALPILFPILQMESGSENATGWRHSFQLGSTHHITSRESQKAARPFTDLQVRQVIFTKNYHSCQCI